MAEALNAHSSNIEEWADERGLAIFALESTITLFTPQFAQSNTHPQVTLVTFDPHFKFNDHIKTKVTPYQHPQGPCWY